MAAGSHGGKGSTRSSDIRPTRLSRTPPGAYRAHTARAGGARRGETDDDTGRHAHRPPRTPPKTPPPPRPPGRGRPDPDGGRGHPDPPGDPGRPAEGHEGGPAPAHRHPYPERERHAHHQGNDTAAGPSPEPDVTEGAGGQGTGAAHTVRGGDATPDHVTERPHAPADDGTPAVTDAATATGTTATKYTAPVHKRTRATGRRDRGRGRRPGPLPPLAAHLPGRLKAKALLSRRPARVSVD